METTTPTLSTLPERPQPPAPETPVVAGWGYRVAAYLVDFGLALVGGVLVGVAFGSEEAGAEVFIGLWVTWFLVTSVAMGIFKGQSVGKRLVGTRVVIEDRPVGFGFFTLLRDQFLRLLYFIPLFFIVDSLWAAFDGQRQSLHDKMTGTHVINAGATPVRGVSAGLVAGVLLAGWIALAVVLDNRSTGSTTRTGSEQPGYSELDREVFVDSCKGEGAAESYCTCLYDYIATRVPYDTFNSVESENIDTWPARLRNVMRDGVEQCS